MSQTIIIDNGDGTYSQQVTTPFDPVLTQTQIQTLQAQLAAAQQLDADNYAKTQAATLAAYQPQIDVLQALLDTATESVPAIADLVSPAKPVTAQL